MLKPFRIRDLYGPVLPSDSPHSRSAYDSSQGPRPDGGNDTAELYKLEHGIDSRASRAGDAPYETSRPGIIQMTAREYDEAITSSPHSSLMYVDDDDGETITVGSAFELAQRLDEPLDPSTSFQGLTGNHSRYKTISNPIHIFDIRRSRSTLDLWRGFEKMAFAIPGTSERRRSSSPQSSVVGTLPTNSPCSPGVTNSYPDTDQSSGLAVPAPQQDIRKDWLRACKPPRMSPNRSDDGSDMQLSGNPFVNERGPLEDYVTAERGSSTHSGADSVESSCSITEEGKRQAQEAGARFHNWKRAPTNDATSTSTSSPLPNPWSSYNHSQARLDDPPESPSEDEPEKHKVSSVEANENEPLLAAFEAQMSKIMEQGTTAERYLNENRTDTADRVPNPTPLAPTEPLNLGSRAPPTPIDFLAQVVNNMLVGATRLSTDLNSRLPEIERQVSNASTRIPGRMDATLQESLRALGSGIQVLANAAQDASLATCQAAAERAGAADHRAIERAVAEKLRDAAGDLSSMGRSIYSSLESGLGTSGPDTRAESSEPNSQPTTTPGNQTRSAETDAGPDTEASEFSAPTKESDISYSGGMIQGETQQTKESLEPRVNLASPPVSADSLAPKPSASRPTVPQQPLYETNSRDTLPTCGTTEASLDYPELSTQTKPTAEERDRTNRRNRSRSPVSISLPYPQNPLDRNPWDRRGSNSMGFSNDNPYPPRRCRGRHQWPHARGSFPLSKLPSLNPTEPPSDFNEPNTTQDTLFLGIPGFELGVTEASIRDLLAEQGFLAKVHLPIDSKSGCHLGFAYLKFPSIYAARAAKEALQGAHLGGKAVNVEFSHGVNFDALQKDTSESKQPENVTAARRAPPSALRPRPSFSLTNPDRNRSLESKPSVTFADADNSPSATTNIKRHRSLGALPLASGGPFPYGSPIYPTSSKLLNKHHNLRKAGDLRNDHVNHTNHKHDSRNKEEDRALLDQEDTDPEFSARYPSLLATNDLRRANTMTSPPARDYLSNPTTGLKSSITRFPPLSQLEARLFGRQHPKPITTSPQHPPVSYRKPEACESVGLDKHLSLGSNASIKLPGSWPQETAETPKLDSFDPTNRVEGGNNAARESRNILNRSNSLVAADPAARLSGPLNPDSERGRSGIENLLKRSATERRANRPWGHVTTCRRPYRGLGDGIVARDPMRQEPSWETYLDHPRNFPKASPPQSTDVPPRHRNWPEMSHRTVPETNVRDIMTGAPEPKDRSKNKIDACVEHLKALGFHNDGEDGEQRLTVYACAVEGDLGDAIEMIEEERKVYEQRPSLV